MARTHRLPAGVTKREWIDRRGDTQERWDVAYTVDGRRRQETFLSEDDALDRAAEVRTDRRRGTYLDPRDGRITFRDYVVNEWLPSKNFPPGTRQQVEMRLRVHVFPTLGQLPLARVKASTIRGWANKLKGAESTKRVIFVHVQDILSCAVDDKRIPTNPCKEPSVKRGRPRAPIREVRDIWTPNEILDIRDELPDRYQIVATLGAQLGLRPGETLGLSPDDVEFLRGVVHVRREVHRLPDGRRIFKAPKYDKVRDVPLPDAARDALAAHLAQFPAVDVTHRWEDPDVGDAVTVPLVVTTATGQSVDLSRFNAEVWRPALRRAGIEWIARKSGPHGCRHYFCSAMLAAGYEPAIVSEWVGHSDPAFTLRRYGHVIKRPDEATLRRRVAEFHRGTRQMTANEKRISANDGDKNRL